LQVDLLKINFKCIKYTLYNIYEVPQHQKIKIFALEIFKTAERNNCP